MAEKIFSSKVKNRVFAGDYVVAPIDMVMCHESFSKAAAKLIDNKIENIWDPQRIAIILDHFIPAPNEKMAKVHWDIRNLVKKYGIKNFYNGNEGVCHQVMIEKGHVQPGNLIVGLDSHTCTYGAIAAAATGMGVSEISYVLAKGEIWFRVPESISIRMVGKMKRYVTAKDIALAIAKRFGTEFAQYKSIEFVDEVEGNLSIDSRLVLSNMSIEYGAKFGFFKIDENTINFFRNYTLSNVEEINPDSDANYEEKLELDVSSLSSLVAGPHQIENVKPADEFNDIRINQAVLGSCTNGRIEDLRIAAAILRGKKISKDVRFLVYPASRTIYLKAIEENLIQILSNSGAIICPPSCGPCFGYHGGMLCDDEICISSTNRNFKGRMGSAQAEIYLASPATVAASAFRGRITDPREIN